jgi:uncharacterized protein (TIGR02466 family)
MLVAGCVAQDSCAAAGCDGVVLDRKHPPPATIILGERAAPDGPKIRPTVKNHDGNIPTLNPASQLYADLMHQATKADSPQVTKLLALAVCHTKPRSHTAWSKLADANMQMTPPTLFWAMHSRLLAALVEEEPEWWEEDAYLDEMEAVGFASAPDNTGSSSPSKHTDIAEAVRKVAAFTKASERAQLWFIGGEYEELKIEINNKFVAEDTKGPFKLFESLFDRILPSLLEWTANGSQTFPPMGIADSTTLADGVAGGSGIPDLWREPSATNDRPLLPGQMRALFTTPIYVINLLDEAAVTIEFNHQLAKQAIAGYETFLSTSEATDTKTGTLHQTAVLNDVFFASQRRTKLTANIPEVKEIMTHIKAACGRYLSEWKLPPSLNHGLPTHPPWFSIHKNGSDHMAHVHYDTSLAAVYYPQINKGDGRLVFEDPRGAHYTDATAADCVPTAAIDCSPVPFATAPFAGNRHYHTPRNGDLIIFPGWLYHSVEPPPADALHSDKHRVSLSFNVDGTWDAVVP